MKGLVFGNGFLGTRLSNYLGYRTVGREEADATNISQIERILELEKPDIVINAVGKTGRPNIDWCETHKEETVLSNVCATANLAMQSSLRKIYFVHLGSGCIYNGDNNGKGFSEEDEPNFYGPQFYAKTKILSEKILKEFPSLILRIRMPIDDKPHDRNLIDKLSRYNSLVDIPNSMTTIPQFLEATEKLIRRQKTGIYNMVNPGQISPYEIMELYRDIVDPFHHFELLSHDELDTITKGKRSNCYLSTDKLKREGITLPEIHDAVRSCLLNYKRVVK